MPNGRIRLHKTSRMEITRERSLKYDSELRHWLGINITYHHRQRERCMQLYRLASVERTAFSHLRHFKIIQPVYPKSRPQ